ncbi:hypothetical protein BJ742DRAFT_772214 [Cladochytrium replicatum]|nr:hypothetical protein BJ742DRAFT_772214 [Cladochytrium replicatum]
MALKIELVKWDEAVKAFSEKKWDQSLDCFEPIADSSKIHFNIAMVYINLNDINSAIGALTRAVTCDPFFAAAYFQRGACYFSMDVLDEAVHDFDDALTFMRSNTYIDYTQLGLDFKLHSFQILFNRGLCFAAAGKSDVAMQDFNEASKVMPKELRGEFQAVDEALRMGAKAAEYLDAFMIPRDKCYKPPASKVKNTLKMDFLGQSKVVATADQMDGYNGFSGKKLRPTLGRQATRARPTGEDPSALTRSGTASRRKNGVGDEGFGTVKREGTLRRGDSLSRRNNNEDNFGSVRSDGGYASRNRRGGNDDDDFPTIQRSKTVGDMQGGTRTIERGQRGPPQQRSESRGRENERGTVGRRGSSAGRGGDAARGYFEGREGRGHQRKGSEPGYSSYGEEPVSAVSANSEKIKVKCHYKDTRMVMMPFDVTFQSFKNRVKEKFGLRDVKLKYRDEEGELVLMTDQEDMDVAFDVAGLTDGSDRFEVWVFD